jgi:hypothetical protein
MPKIKWQSKATIDAEKAQENLLRTNKLTIEEKALLALETNRTFLGLTSPTNAQTLAQVKSLTRQNNAIIRLLLNKLDGTD